MKKLWCILISYTSQMWPRVKPRPVLAGATQVWYGRVNWWAVAGKKALQKDLIECAASGVSGYMIEMAGWAGTSAIGREAEIKSRYTFLVEQCRVLGLWLFVSVVNDNSGSGKYGDTGPHLEDSNGTSRALIQCIMDNGPLNVIVQPVAETYSAGGRSIEAYAVRVLGAHDFKLVSNEGSRPEIKAEWAHYRAWHPFNVTDRIPRDALAVSDTGKIIQQLGSGLSGPGNPMALLDWVSRIRRIGCPVAGYYAFLRKDHDKAAIRALGDS